MSLRIFVAIVIICLSWLGSACSEQPATLNLLYNSTFQKQTNRGIPDYWDLHHAAAAALKNLYDQYGIDESVTSPVPGVKVLKIINPEDNFPFLMLWPNRFDPQLPPGEYTFSVYLRANRFGANYRVYNQGDATQSRTYHLSTDWKRYSITFRNTATDREIQPVLVFETRGSYYIAAPQLESGGSAGPFQPEANAVLREGAIAGKALSDEHTLRRLLQKGRENSLPLSAVFEYDYYTDDITARLFATSNYHETLSLRISCQNANGKLSGIAGDTLKPRSETGIAIPLVSVPEGELACTIKAFSGNAFVAAVTAKSQKQKRSPNGLEVRVNQQRRFISVNKKPFQIIGIATHFRPPDWYFKDLAGHGFNTIFYRVPVNEAGVYDLAAAKNFLDSAARYRLKVIVGLPLEGDKPADWRQRLARFCRLVGIFRTHSAVLGWWAFDEPHSNTWKESELLEVYQIVKAADPHRIVLGNWCDIPETGREPFGTLASTDVYSHDYYAFTFLGHTLYGFGNENSYVSRTASMRNKLSHVFIQLYGNIDAWREPTGDELNFMTFLALMNGSMTTYWDTKSNCRETWDRIATINSNTAALLTALFLDPLAREVRGPGIQGNFLYSLWRKEKTWYAIVLNIKDSSEPLVMDVTGFVHGNESKIAMFLGNGPGQLAKGSIVDLFRPYEAKVYTFSQ